MCDHSCRHVDPYNRIPAQHEEGLTKCRCPMGECVAVKQKPVAEQVHMPKACEHSKPLSLPTLKLTKQVQTEISKPIKSTTGGNNLHSLLGRCQHRFDSVSNPGREVHPFPSNGPTIASCCVSLRCLLLQVLVELSCKLAPFVNLC